MLTERSVTASSAAKEKSHKETPQFCADRQHTCEKALQSPPYATQCRLAALSAAKKAAQSKTPGTHADRWQRTKSMRSLCILNFNRHHVRPQRRLAALSAAKKAAQSKTPGTHADVAENKISSITVEP